MAYKAAIFDMDGTILNTLDDLTDAINFAMELSGHEHDFTTHQVAQFFGSGVYVAIKRALSAEQGFPYDRMDQIGLPNEPEDCFKDHKVIDAIAAVYKPYYDAHCDIKTGPYPGILNLLRDLHSHEIKLAVVSNKPDPAVQTLVRDKFMGLFDFAVGEKENVKRKPAPDMIDECMKALEVERHQCVYIGDSEIDMLTGQFSNIPVISVDWGFRSHEYLEARGAKRIVSDASELLDAIIA